ncbi:MAG: LysR family transcriptional regulator [Pseudomonadota bacterium]
MDLNLARTFLAVVETGNFLGAAKRLYVTQSTVSMRIKSLEDQLGRTLFERNKTGASLTPAGAQFERHAAALVRIWEQAKLTVALPAGHETALTIGGSYSLWDGFLLKWLPWMRQAAPHVALRAQRGTSADLMAQLVNGSLDLAIMHTPANRADVDIIKLFDDELVLVSSEPKPAPGLGANYVFVNWGPEFLEDHQLNFPEHEAAGLAFDLGTLGVDFLLDNPSSGYFPRRVVAPLIAAGTLARVPDVPSFFYPVYAVLLAEPEEEPFATALKGLHDVADQVGGHG